MACSKIKFFTVPFFICLILDFCVKDILCCIRKSAECPELPGEYVIKQPKAREERISWANPNKYVDTNELRLTRVYGQDPESKFKEGYTKMLYKIEDFLRCTKRCSYTITVKVRRCKAPSYPQNGRVSCDTEDYIYGTNCNFTCDPGYKLDGWESRKCLKNEIFSGGEVYCNEITCEKLLEPENGNIICTDGTNYRSVCRFSCNEGYELIGSRIRECLGNGRFDGQTTTCKRIECNRPEPFQHGILSYSTTRYNHIVKYSCEDGYVLVGPKERKCLKNKQYSGPKPRCRPAECNPLPWPLHGSMTCGKNAVYKDKCKFYCDEGYNLFGSRVRECGKDGKYSGTETRCEIKKCSKLILPEHGVKLTCTDGNNYKSVCFLKCDSDKGFSAVRGETTQCFANATWTNPFLRCEDIEPPLFKNCPKHSIMKILENNKTKTVVYWPQLRATDNSGQVRGIKLTSGLHSGSAFSKGITTVRYEVSDSSGNQAVPCVFSVVVEEAVCPVPDFNGKYLYIRGKCAAPFGLGTICQLACRFDIQLNHTLNQTHIVCKSKGNGSREGYWDWGQGTGKNVSKNAYKPYCSVRQCPNLTPPENGAISCDVWLGGKFCQMQCQKGYDIPDSSQFVDMFVCPEKKGQWIPHSKVTDCTDIDFPEQMNMKYKFYYYDGDCGEETKPEIRRNFIEALRHSAYDSTCNEHCKSENVEVVCGDLVKRSVSRRRRRRPKFIVSFKVVLDVTKSNKTVSETVDEHSAQLNNISASLKRAVNQFALNVQGKRSVPRLRIFSPVPSCRPGTLRGKRSRLACVPCPRGTFYYAERSDCKACSLGEYQQHTGKHVCERCPQGQTTLTLQAVSKSECIDYCQAGFYSPTGAVPCTPCPRGKYQPSVNSKLCIQCPASTTTLKTGSVHKSDCTVYDVMLMGPMDEKLIATVTSDIHDFSFVTWIKLGYGTKDGVSFIVNSPFYTNDVIIKIANNIKITLRNIESVVVPVEMYVEKWYHISVVYGQQTLSVYQNGREVYTRNTTSSRACVMCRGSVMNVLMQSKSDVFLQGMQVLPSVLGRKVISKLQLSCENTFSQSATFALYHLMAERSRHINELIPSSCAPSSEANCSSGKHENKCGCSNGSCRKGQRSCHPGMCVNNGTCIENETSATCVCEPGFRGRHCHIVIVNGGWSRWSQWSYCTVTCGTGVKTRKRLCNSPLPDLYGKNCTGDAIETVLCTEPKCPINGGWSEWSAWSRCSKTCGNGYRERQRACNNPEPDPEGEQCDGDDTDFEICTGFCPIDGGWTEWLPWLPCPVTCGRGTRERRRVCNRPLPGPGGKTCDGPNTEVGKCSKEKCPECKKSDLTPGPGVWLSCNERNNNISCSVKCRPGLVFPEEPLQYTCIDSVWTPSLRVIPCTEVTSPVKVGFKYTVDYNISSDAGLSGYLEEVSDKLESVGTNLSCVVVGDCEIDSVESACLNKAETAVCTLEEDDVQGNIQGVITVVTDVSPGNLSLYNIHTLNNPYADILLETWRQFHSPYTITNQSRIAHFMLESLKRENVNNQLLKILTKWDMLGKSHAAAEYNHHEAFSLKTSNTTTAFPTFLVARPHAVCPAGSIQGGVYCMKCPPGTYFAESECKTCDYGFYQEDCGMTQCNPCDGFSFTDFMNSVFPSECKADRNLKHSVIIITDETSNIYTIYLENTTLINKNYKKKITMADYDVESRDIYFISEENVYISRRNGTEDVVFKFLEGDKVSGFSGDFNRKLIFYILETVLGVLSIRAQNDSYVSEIRTDMEYGAKHLIVHSQKTCLFWVEGSNIVTSLYDGTLRNVIYKDKSLVQGIILNPSDNKLYWVSSMTVQSINMDGSGHVSHIKIKSPMIGLTQHYFFFIDSHGGLVRVNKDGSGQSKIINVGAQFGLMKMYNKSQIVTDTSVCSTNNGGCSHICLPLPSMKRQCVCPTRHLLQRNNVTCRQEMSESYMTPVTEKLIYPKFNLGYQNSLTFAVKACASARLYLCENTSNRYEIRLGEQPGNVTSIHKCRQSWKLCVRLRETTEMFLSCAEFLTFRVEWGTKDGFILSTRNGSNFRTIISAKDKNPLNVKFIAIATGRMITGEWKI